MILNIVYLLVGVTVGFLIKHEIDIKQRRKRIQQRMRAVASRDSAPYNETLNMIKELNISLLDLTKK